VPTRTGRLTQPFTTDGYSFFILGWFLLRLLLADRFWWLAVVNTIALFLFLPLPLLWVTALITHSKRLMLVLSGPSAVFLLLYGQLFLPRFTAPDQNGSHFRAMTLNLLYSNQDVESIVQAIQTADPDLVGVQEMTGFHIQQLGQRLADKYPYQNLRPGNRYGDVGLFSRYPIETADDFPLPPRHLAMQATVNINGRILHVFVVHLMPNQLGGVPLAEMPERARERYATRSAEIVLLALIAIQTIYRSSQISS
jgi:endonuclease/exonuclease/phosphatase (EEP) superfamily protein YafD